MVFLQPLDQAGNRGDRLRIVTTGCRHPEAFDLAAAIFEGNRFDFCPAEIDPDVHGVE